jgi:choline monooxygenase
VNLVKPISANKTKVSFITYLHGENKFEGASSNLMDKVEREDEFVVEGVHQGLNSRIYKSERFSPTREQGVHHFHRMMAERLKWK